MPDQNCTTKDLALILPVGSKDGKPTVNARDLWKFLEVKSQFSQWIKRRLNDGKFVQGVDFVIIVAYDYNSSGAPRKECHLTHYAAEHIGMMESTEKGKEIRNYFQIARDAAMRQPAPAAFPVPTTFAEALRLAADQQDQIQALEHKIEEDKGKVDFAERVRNTTDCISVKEMAKLLGTGQNRLYALLREKGLIEKSSTQPIQRYIDRGFLRVIEVAWTDDWGKPRSRPKTVVTGKGQVYIKRLLDHFELTAQQNML